MKLNINIDGYIDKYDGFSLAKMRNIVESNPEATDIHLRINSEGGDVFEGWAIHDYLLGLQKTKNITAKVEGIVASITTVIIGALPKDNVSGTKNSTGYIHNPFWTPNAPQPMEAHQLEKLAGDLKLEQEKIYDFYKKRLTASATEILELMTNEIKLTADKMVEIGLIGSIENALTPSFRNQLPIKAQIKNEIMNKELSKEDKNWIEKKFSSIMNLLKGTIKNMVVELADGTQIFVETEDGEFEGKRAFIMVDGNMTDEAAPNGEHALSDGRIIVVEDGIVTEVKEATDVEALKAELETAKAQAEQYRNEMEAAAGTITEMEAKIEAATKEFNTFKSQILNGKFEAAQTFPKGKGNEEKSLVEKALDYRASQKK